MCMFKSSAITVIKNQDAYQKLSKFFYGKYYPLYLAMFTAFFYVAKLPVVGLGFLVTVAIITLICFRDLLPFMPLPMMVMQCMSDLTFFSNPIAIILIALAGIALITHFIIYPVQKIKLGKLFYPLIFVNIALFAGGLFSPYVISYANGLSSSISVGILTLVVYLLFSNYYCPPKDFDYKEHFLYYLAVCGALIAVELIFHTYQVSINLIKQYDMGYGNTNIVGAALLITTPAIWYFVAKAKNILPPIFGLILSYAGVYLSKSDGSLMLSLLCLPVIVYFVLKHVNQKRRNHLIKGGLIFLMVVTVALIVICTKHDLASTIISYLKAFKLDSGRTPLFIEATQLFFKYPIFGVGLGYSNPNSTIPAVDGHIIAYLYNFHSTFFHTVATMGVVGLVAYVIYYIARYKILLKKCDFYRITAYLSFTVMQCYGMVDACEFHALPLLMFCTLLHVTTEKANNEQQIENLPLTDFKEF